MRLKTKIKKKLKTISGRKKEIIVLLAVIIGTAMIGISGQKFEVNTGAEISVPKKQKEIKIYEVMDETIREVTAYNAGVAAQTDNSPCVAANGENICDALDYGFKRCAANFVPFGTTLAIDHYGECVVTDRMNSRYENRVDIAMSDDEISRAKNFGLQKLNVRILKLK